MSSVIRFILLFLLTPTILYAESAIPVRNQAILSSSTDNLLTPTKEETSTALNSIYGFLEKPDKQLESWTPNKDYKDYLKGEIANIRKNIEHYKVQFLGIRKNGVKIILCNFFPEDMSDTGDWKRRLIEVNDGGYWFWQVEYDPANDKILMFTSNGYA